MGNLCVKREIKQINVPKNKSQLDLQTDVLKNKSQTRKPCDSNCCKKYDHGKN
jgi:hypothetical protein|tara:strand:+ start:524 stop:682 length:159 start_codon:yes stop_codon:yes gene_type:complete